MSAKNRRQTGQMACKNSSIPCVGRRKLAIDEAVALSGLTKQDYIIAKLTNRDVVVIETRVFSGFKS